MKSFLFCALIATAAAAPALQLTRSNGAACRLTNDGKFTSTCDVSYKGNSIAGLAKSLGDLKTKVSNLETNQNSNTKAIYAALTALENKWIAGQQGDLTRHQLDQAALKKAEKELNHDINQVNHEIYTLEKEVEANDVDIKNLQNTDVQHDARIKAKAKQGQKGATGSQGIQGQKGEKGSHVVGAKGQTGAKGARGARGATGATGAQGIQGTQGVTGSKGSTGARGARGYTGSKGQKGVTGSTGARGATGSKGQKGVTGSRGATGATGARGYTGSKGQKGVTGSRGATGSKGQKGVTGARGYTGARGSTGATGAKGQKGVTGARGATGATGARGANGSSASCSSNTGTPCACRSGGTFRAKRCQSGHCGGGTLASMTYVVGAGHKTCQCYARGSRGCDGRCATGAGKC